MNIDWKRVCKPQADGYDVHVMSEFLKEKYNWVKIKPTTEYTICDGHVAVLPDPYHKTISDIQQSNHTYPANYPIAAVGAYEIWDNTRAKNIERYLSVWEEGYQSLKLFLDQFWPLLSYANVSSGQKLIQIEGATLDDIKRQVDANSRISRGCTSGHYNPEHHGSGALKFINAVYVTINSNQGCAEGIYHEVGHARLNALNLHIETHDGRLFTNTQDELYESPIRRDKKRPLSAVIQAIYSWIIFGENDLQCAKLENNALESAEYLIGNLPKIEDGLSTIRAHIKCSPEGMKFFDSYFEWGEDVCSRARMLCQQQFGENYAARYEAACQYKTSQVVPN